MKPQRQAVFKMWVGKTLHEEAQKHLVKSGFITQESVEKEVRLGSYFGKIDGLTTNLPGIPLAVLEFKTAADDAITKKDWPEHYKWQGLAYAMAVGAEKVLFVQLGTNYGLGRENVVMVSQEWQRKINRHIQLMDKLWKVYETTKKLPKMHYHRFGWEDKYCPFIGLGDVPQRTKKKVYKPYLEPKAGEPGLGEDAGEFTEEDAQRGK